MQCKMDRRYETPACGGMAAADSYSRSIPQLELFFLFSSPAPCPGSPPGHLGIRQLRHAATNKAVPFFLHYMCGTGNPPGGIGASLRCLNRHHPSILILRSFKHHRGHHPVQLGRVSTLLASKSPDDAMERKVQSHLHIHILHTHGCCRHMMRRGQLGMPL